MALQQDLPRGRCDQVGSAHDVGDALQGVVDDDRELVREKPVGALDDEVADLAREILRLRTLEPVAPLDARGAHAKAPRARRARRAIRRNAVAAGAGVDVLSACADRCARELAPRARALVDVAMRAQSIERCRVRVAALGLSNDGPIPRETVALERRQDRALRARPRAREVDVLDAHEPLAVRGPGVAIARDGGDQRAEMQRSGGRRREAAARDHRAPVNVTGTPCGDGAGAYCQWRAMVAMTPVGYSGRPRLPL